MRFSCAGLRRLGRPRGGVRPSRSPPPLRQRRYHRIAETRDTPSLRATSAWLAPSSKSRAALSRRFFSDSLRRAPAALAMGAR